MKFVVDFKGQAVVDEVDMTDAVLKVGRYLESIVGERKMNIQFSIKKVEVLTEHE